MKLYVYDTASGKILLELNNVCSYTDMEVITEMGLYGPLAEGCELSRTKDCTETLRANWRKLQGPSTEERIAVLEEQLAQSDETAIALYEAQEEQEAINAQQDETLMEIYEMIG